MCIKMLNMFQRVASIQGAQTSFCLFFVQTHPTDFKFNNDFTYIIPFHGIIQKKSASGSRILPLIISDKKALFSDVSE